MAMALSHPSDKLWHNFCRLIKLTKGKKKPDAICYAMAKMVLAQETITDEKFNEIKKKLEEFYTKQDEAIAKIASDIHDQS